jgi:hypothetical protein
MKTWMGVTSGTYMGRDDGYPEKKYRHYDSIEELAKDFGEHSDEEYFELTEVHPADMRVLVKETLEKQNEKRKEDKKAKIEKQIEEMNKQFKDLKKQLKDLS